MQIYKQLNVSRMTVHWVEQRLKTSQFLKNCLRAGRPQVISQAAIKKNFEDDLCQKMTRLAQKKKKEEQETSTRLWNDLNNHGNQIFIFSDGKKTFTVGPVFNIQNDPVVTFGIDVSEHRRV